MRRGEKQKKSGCIHCDFQISRKKILNEFNLKIMNYTLSSDGQRYRYWNVAVMFLENLGPKTSLSVPN